MRPHRGQSEMVQVIGCTPACGVQRHKGKRYKGLTTLTISPGLVHPNWAAKQSPQFWLIQPNENIGVRNLVLDGSHVGYHDMTSAIAVNNIANFWIRNVAFEKFPNITLHILQSMHGDICSNYIYDSGQSDPNSDNSGINWYGSANLFCNNIVHNAHLAMISNGPSVGNAIVGNYTLNGYTGNATLFGSIWPNHSNGSNYNLYEHNVTQMIDFDQTHGGALMTTIYRSLVTGWESCSNGNCGSEFKEYNLFPIMQLSYNRYPNIVDNVLGTPGITTKDYERTDPGYFAMTPAGYVYNWASGNPVNPGGGYAGGPIPIDVGVMTTSYRWGNWDTFHKATRWDTAEVPSNIIVYPQPVPTNCTESKSCPASFYFPARPTWWSASDPFPAIGSDIANGNVGQCGGTVNTPGQYALAPATSSAQCGGQELKTAWAGHVNAIPAMRCYLNTLGGPPDGTGDALPFDANACYGNTPTPEPPEPGKTYTGTIIIKGTFVIVPDVQKVPK
jgi:hypothetical protein